MWSPTPVQLVPAAAHAHATRLHHDDSPHGTPDDWVVAGLSSSSELQIQALTLLCPLAIKLEANSWSPTMEVSP